MAFMSSNGRTIKLLRRVRLYPRTRFLIIWAPALLASAATIVLSVCLLVHAMDSRASALGIFSKLTLSTPGLNWLLVLLAAYAAGAINAVAGGGSLITFPALLAVGVPPLIANATNTIALIPSQLASAYSYRRNLKQTSGLLFVFAMPAILGGLLGAWLLLWSGDACFAQLSPWLILVASALILLKGRWGDKQSIRKEHSLDSTEAAGSPGENTGSRRILKVLCLTAIVFAVATYGGYFGAGGSFLTLAALGFAGLRNIHQMNGLKNLFSASYNSIATIVFVFAGRIDWLAAGVVIAGMVLGAITGAHLAVMLGQRRVHQLIVLIGVGAAAWVFLHH